MIKKSFGDDYGTTKEIINLFFIDGTPDWGIKCSIPNRTGVIYKIPRTDLE